MTLKRATLAEQAYEELRTRIVSGALQAGSRLLAEELATQLAISPTPVKEALALLERDGLVEGNSRRASVVRRFRAGDVRHIFAARMMLELDAVRHGAAVATITPSFVADLADVFRRQVEHARTHRPVIFGEALRLDREFHETLMRLAANPITAAWHRGVLAQTQTILTYSFDTYDAERAHSEHAAIIEALRSGDPAQIEASLRAHLIASRDAILNRRPILDEAAA